MNGEACPSVDRLSRFLRFFKVGDIPKLLDFGIAKILGPWPEEAPAYAPSLLNPLTPDYASPEQLRGAAVTTASDLYSLGVLLYELLAGERPYDVAGKPLDEAIRLVCETEPVRRHAASPLSGDLGAIVDKAMRKEPLGRYASAEELSADIGRHLAGQPVLARRGSFRYVARKFVGRHRFGAATALLVALLIVAGGAAIVRQAHIAERQRGRAERRFQDVRQLANALIFEVHDSIKDLPGATQARKLLVSRALAYLDSLSSEAGGDVSLQRELATAYERVADVQGNPRYANLGDTPSALVSYRKALTIRETLARDDPGNRDLMLGLAGTYDNIGWCLDATSDLAGALEHLRKALTIKETLAPRTNGPKEADQLAGAYYGVATVLSEIGDLQDALEHYRKAASIRNAAGDATPSQRVTLRTHLAGDYAGMARVLDSQGNTAAAIEAQAQATALLRDVSRVDPTNATVQRFLAWGEEYQGIYQEKSGLLDDALQSFQEAERVFEMLSATDPSDALTERRLAFTAVHIGTVLAKKGAPAEGLKHLEAALASFQALAARVPTNDYIRAGFADCYSSMGLAHVTMAGPKEASGARQHLRLARSYFQKSLELWLDLQHRGALVTEDARKVPEIEEEIAKCDAALGPSERAETISRASK